jgi:hypothetical protein
MIDASREVTLNDTTCWHYKQLNRSVPSYSLGLGAVPDCCKVGYLLEVVLQLSELSLVCCC